MIDLIRRLFAKPRPKTVGYYRDVRNRIRYQGPPVPEKIALEREQRDALTRQWKRRR